MSHHSNLDNIVQNSALSINLLGKKFCILIHITHNAQDFSAYIFASGFHQSLSGSHHLHRDGIAGTFLHRTFSVNFTTISAISHLGIYPSGSESFRAVSIIHLLRAHIYPINTSILFLFLSTVSAVLSFAAPCSHEGSSDESHEGLSVESDESHHPDLPHHHPLHHPPLLTSFHIALTTISSHVIVSGGSGSHATNSYHVLVGFSGYGTGSP